MLARGGGDVKDAGAFLHQAHCGEEREHDVGGSLDDLEFAADGRFVGGVFGEPGEEIKVDERGTEQIDGIEPVAQSVEFQRIGGGKRREIERVHAR